jgi:hypothetical protein
MYIANYYLRQWKSSIFLIFHNLVFTLDVFRDNLQLGMKWETAAQIGAQTLMLNGYNFLDNFKVGLY